MTTHDAAIDRIRARARFAAALTLVALMLGGLFGGTIEALMRPLITAVAQLEVATHADPVQGSRSRQAFQSAARPGVRSRASRSPRTDPKEVDHGYPKSTEPR